MRARSAVVNLYGDHLADRNYWAPIAGVVTLLTTSGITPAAARTAVSRLVAEGWLEARAAHGMRGYQASAAARKRLVATHRRIYRRAPAPWDGTWHLLVPGPSPDRATRDRVAATLGFLGYGRLATQTWVSPRANPERVAALGGLGVTWREFRAEADHDPIDLAAGVWDLTDLAERYRAFLATADAVDRQAGADPLPVAAYRLRTELVHQWRTFLFVDADLPDRALPADWPGTRARDRFRQVADRLRPPARIFVETTLQAVQDR